MAEQAITGGRQCGAIRYRLAKKPERAAICFCRMCQKASGNYFAAHVSSTDDDLSWTRGTLAIFRSSEAAERGFCRDCGTPLTYVVRGSGKISITAGSLDDPDIVAPSKAFGLEGRPGWFDAVCGLDGPRTEDDIAADELPRFRSRQHPDHDT